MGLAAGGMMFVDDLSYKLTRRSEQRIVKDKRLASRFDFTNGKKIVIHILSTAQWESITGTLAPPSTVTRAMYESEELPWFRLVYDERTEFLGTAGRFSKIRTLDMLERNETLLDRLEALDLNKALPCDRCGKKKDKPACCVLRPCAHTVCGDCLVSTLAVNGGVRDARRRTALTRADVLDLQDARRPLRRLQDADARAQSQGRLVRARLHLRQRALGRRPVRHDAHRHAAPPSGARRRLSRVVVFSCGTGAPADRPARLSCFALISTPLRYPAHSCKSRLHCFRDTSTPLRGPRARSRVRLASALPALTRRSRSASSLGSPACPRRAELRRPTTSALRGRSLIALTDGRWSEPPTHRPRHPRRRRRLPRPIAAALQRSHDRHNLGGRLARLQSGRALLQQPRPRSPPACAAVRRVDAVATAARDGQSRRCRRARRSQCRCA